MVEENPNYILNVFNALLSVEASNSNIVKDLSEVFQTDKEAFLQNIENNKENIKLTSMYLERLSKKQITSPELKDLIQDLVKNSIN